MQKNVQVVRVGRAVQKLARLRGGGTSLPGLIVEKLDPTFIPRILAALPYGTVIITGTNGKTTTTKAVTQLLEAAGLRVFTNRSGSNMARGVASSLLSALDQNDNLPADIAVLELDEAHAAHFVTLVHPTYVLLLNVLRDQLDRYGEVDHTAHLLEQVADQSLRGVIINREDPQLLDIGQRLAARHSLTYFGIDPSLKRLFPGERDLYRHHNASTLLPPASPGEVIVAALNGHQVTYQFDNALQAPITLRLDGIYNAVNMAAALALARRIIADPTQDERLLHEAASVNPAFGRGESIAIGASSLELVLTKNPVGFRLALDAYRNVPARSMIAINDQPADGRDVSWLWDVDFSPLQDKGVAVVSGSRAYDMALRLHYDQVHYECIILSLEQALDQLLKSSQGQPMRVYCTYTAMLRLRRLLAKKYQVETVQ